MPWQKVVAVVVVAAVVEVVHHLLAKHLPLHLNQQPLHQRLSLVVQARKPKKKGRKNETTK